MSEAPEERPPAAPAGRVPGPAAGRVPGEAGRIETPPPTPSTTLADGEWHRLHPMTPLLRGGIAVVAILGIVLVNLRDFWVDLFLGDVFGGDVPNPQDDLIARLLASPWLGAIIGGVALILALIVVGFWLSWRMHSFRVTDELVEVRSGILNRRHRRARLDRIQGVDVVRPLLARIVGAAKLDVQTAGQDGSVALAFLGSRQADALRAEILRAASGARAQAADGPVAAAPTSPSAFIQDRLADLSAPELDPALAQPESVVHMHPARLVGSIVLSGTTFVLLGLIAVIVVVVALTREWFIVITVVPIGIGFAVSAVQRFTKSLRYSIAGTPDGVRVGFGLLSTANETIPPGRIHAVHIHQPLLWRPFGWWSMTIARATSRSMDASGQRPSSSLLPVGDLGDVRRVLALVLPDLDEADEALLLTGITGSGEDGGFTISPPRARAVRWFSRRRNGMAFGGSSVLMRTGAIWRQLTVVPLERVQSTALARGPLARAQRLAAVETHTVGGVIAPRVGALDERDAAAWFARIAATAAADPAGRVRAATAGRVRAATAGRVRAEGPRIETRPVQASGLDTPPPAATRPAGPTDPGAPS